jgi:hypothetical protein
LFQIILSGMKYSIYIILTFLLIQNQTIHAQDACGTDRLHTQAMEDDPAYRETILQNEIKVRDMIQSGDIPRSVSLGNDGIYYIPVVVHIVHTGEAIGTGRNPTDTKVQAAIDHMNKIFAAGSGFTNSVAFPVKFILAKRSPDCLPTNGIIRVNGTDVPNYAAKGVTISGTSGYATDISVKNLSRWPNTDYYNIWVVHNIQSYEGFAYYPGAPSSVDGTMIRVSSINNLNTTLAHELGHGFNLRHTFEGDNNGSICPDTSRDCAISGDLVCDTEPHRRPSGCPSDPNPCTGQSFFNTQFNIMNYSSCKNRFTQGQRERFIAAFSLRTALVNSTAWLPPGVSPAMACIPELLDTTTFTGAGITRLSLNRIDHTSSNATQEGALLDKTCSQGDTLYLNVVYPISIRTQSRIQNVRAYLDLNNNGQFESTEKIFTSNGNTAFQTHSGSFALPGSSAIGPPLRLRVISDVNTNVEPLPCGPFLHGQAEDYTIVIKVPPAAAGIIAGLRDTICYAGNPAEALFSVLPVGVNLSYQWFYKEGIAIAPVGSQISGWNAVPGATGSSYTPPAGLTSSRTYSCQISEGGGDPIWAAGVHYTIVLPQPGNGGLSGSWTILTGTSPGAMSLFPLPAGDRSFTYQWYSKTGIASAPSGTSTIGWTMIPAGNVMPFDPGPISQAMTYACFVTPLGNPPCGAAGWASGARQISVVNSWFNTGKLADGDTTLCFGADPDSVYFASLPQLGSGGSQPGGGRNYQFRWCYRPGIHPSPVGPYTADWIIIAGASNASYDPGPQTQSVTFACFIAMGGIMQEGGWAEGCIQINILTQFDPGKVSSGEEAICTGEEASIITMEELPSGSELYTYQWHFKEGTTPECPSGNTVEGWIPVGDDTENSISPGSIGSARTYALLVSPSGNPSCGSTQWAEGCRKLSLLPELSYGTLEQGDEYFANEGDPGLIGFSELPEGAGGYSYQWYKADTLVSAPLDLDLSLWQMIPGGTAQAYDPPMISQSTSYACMVSPAEPSCGGADWATGTRQITVDVITRHDELFASNWLTARPNPFNETSYDSLLFAEPWFGFTNCCIFPRRETGSHPPIGWIRMAHGCVSCGATGSWPLPLYT